MSLREILALFSTQISHLTKTLKLHVIMVVIHAESDVRCFVRPNSNTGVLKHSWLGTHFEYSGHLRTHLIKIYNEC